MPLLSGAPQAALALAGALLMAAVAALWAEAALSEDGAWDGRRALAAMAPFAALFLLLELGRARLPAFLDGPGAGLAYCSFYGSCTLRSFATGLPEFLAFYVGALSAGAFRRKGTGVLDALGAGLRRLAADPLFALMCLAAGLLLRGFAAKLLMAAAFRAAVNGTAPLEWLMLGLDLLLRLLMLSAAVALPVHALRRRMIEEPS